MAIQSFSETLFRYTLNLLPYSSNIIESPVEDKGSLKLTFMPCYIDTIPDSKYRSQTDDSSFKLAATIAARFFLFSAGTCAAPIGTLYHFTYIALHYLHTTMDPQDIQAHNQAFQAHKQAFMEDLSFTVMVMVIVAATLAAYTMPNMRDVFVCVSIIPLIPIGQMSSDLSPLLPNSLYASAWVRQRWGLMSKENALLKANAQDNAFIKRHCYKVIDRFFLHLKKLKMCYGILAPFPFDISSPAAFKSLLHSCVNQKTIPAYDFDLCNNADRAFEGLKDLIGDDTMDRSWSTRVTQFNRVGYQSSFEDFTKSTLSALQQALNLEIHIDTKDLIQYIVHNRGKIFQNMNMSKINTTYKKYLKETLFDNIIPFDKEKKEYQDLYILLFCFIERAKIEAEKGKQIT